MGKKPFLEKHHVNLHSICYKPFRQNYKGGHTNVRYTGNKGSVPNP